MISWLPIGFDIAIVFLIGVLLIWLFVVNRRSDDAKRIAFTADNHLTVSYAGSRWIVVDDRGLLASHHDLRIALDIARLGSVKGAN